MAATVSLLDQNPGTPLLWDKGEPVSRGSLVAAACTLAARLPEHTPLVNLCQSRYGFLSALVAAALRHQPCRMPTTTSRRHGEARSRQSTPAECVLSEDPTVADITVAAHPRPPDNLPLPPLAAESAAAIVFTSGSTGQPKAHVKTWLSLWYTAHNISVQLLPDQPTHLVATVPMHHMYGLETSVILPLISRHSISSERPVFPDDVRAALENIPPPRTLITTPVHLRALLTSRTRLPALNRIISATAPLPVALAARAEAAFHTEVHEIYGCTEAGSIASRRSTAGPDWTVLDDIHVEQHGEHSRVLGPHLDVPVRLFDVIEHADDRHFRLCGRESDMVKVGGNRASLTELTQTLLSVEGVVDGVIFQPDAKPGNAVIRRLAAFVVAPDASEAEVLTALSALVDPVFLPRPLRKLNALPRDGTGKLPRTALQRLLADG